MEPSQPKNHEDHIAGKGYNSMRHFNLVHMFILLPQAMKISDAKASVKEWKKLETIPAWQLGKVKSKKEVILKAQEDKRKVRRKSNGCHCYTARQLAPYQHTLRCKWRMHQIRKTECPDVWIRVPRHKWPKSWANIEDPVALLDRNLYGHPLAGLLWERHVEKGLLEL